MFSFETYILPKLSEMGYEFIYAFSLVKLFEYEMNGKMILSEGEQQVSKKWVEGYIGASTEGKLVFVAGNEDEDGDFLSYTVFDLSKTF